VSGRSGSLPPAAARGSHSAALLLTLLCTPAFASTGYNVACDRAVTSAPTLDIPVQSLTLRHVDLGAAASKRAEDVLQETADDAFALAARAPSVSTAPRVERILREIFDESAPLDQEDSDATPISSPNAASLRELTEDGLREKSRSLDVPDESGIQEAGTESPSANARVPGIPEDELARYRRQMFRTDI